MSTMTAQPEKLVENLTIKQRSHYGRWVAGIVSIAILVGIVNSFVHAQIDWPVVGQYLGDGQILKGLVITIVLTLVSMFIGIVIGVIVAIMRVSKNPVTLGIGWLYVWIFRGTPVYLQLLLWFNIALVYPVVKIPGIYTGRTVDLVSPFVAAVLGLGINQGAYTSEIVRAGLLSVDEGQREAAEAIGMSSGMILWRIVLPQAMRMVIPPMGNEFIGLLKTTSLATAIGVMEILNVSQKIYFVNNRIMELLLVATFWYLVVVSLFSIAQYFLERYFSRGTSNKVESNVFLDYVKKLRNRKGAK
jgi:polar amino acid transport system permease protein